jgi:hypothetical protein
VTPSSSTHELIKLSKNATALFSLGTMDRVANFVFTIVAVRVLSQYAFGSYTLIQALLMFGGLIVNFGDGSLCCDSNFSINRGDWKLSTAISDLVVANSGFSATSGGCSHTQKAVTPKY